MAQDPQSKPAKRRPAKSRSPLKSANKKTKAKAKAKKTVKKPVISKKTVAKKPTTKKIVAKKPVKKPATRKRTPIKKAPNTQPTQSQLISIPLGRGAKLVLTVNRTKTTDKTTIKSKAQKSKAKKTTKSKQQAKLNKRQQLLISLAFLLTGLLGTAFFSMQALASNVQPITSPTLVLRSKAPVTVYMPSSEPTRLRIPDIKINTAITPVGLDKEGALIVPSDSNVAGWYDKSPTPGQKGPSVIDGHLDSLTGIAVFWRLRELVPGQIVEIDRADGSTAKFAIDKVASYSQSNFPTDEVYGNLNHSGLRLITCGGTFDKATGHYSENVIVFGTFTK